MDYFFSVLQTIANHLDVQQWALVLVGLVVFGMFTLRGFGSRTSY